MLRKKKSAGSFPPLFCWPFSSLAWGLWACLHHQRTKETGIRKVLEASVPRILWLISRWPVLLLGAANLIAWPLVWRAMHSWLSNFAYRINLTWTIFALSTGAGLCAALVSVDWRSIRAA
jgi:putative ABC transport system permease protein